MSLADKTYTVLLFAGVFAASCAPAFARPYASLEEQKAARLKTIDAALAKAELEFFKKEPAPALVSQEPSPGVFSATDENSFGLSEQHARGNISDANIKKHLFEIDAELFHFRYKEPDVMRDVGTMSGFYGRYAYRPVPGELFYTKMINLYKIEGRFSLGEVDYKAENNAELKNIDDWAAELRGILGKEYIDGPFTTILYSGAGYRYLNDNGSGRRSRVGSATYYFYQRESNYYYLPIGVEFSNQISERWSFAMLGEYDWLVYGLQISHLSDGNQFLSTKNDDIENPQKNGYGLRASLRLMHASGPANLIVEPFIRFWNIENSDRVSAFVDGATSNFIEPKNNTIETGLKVGVQF